MGTIKGDRKVEIEAPIERCYEIAADIENAMDWQGSLQDVEVLERDAAEATGARGDQVRRQGQDRQSDPALLVRACRPASAGSRRRGTRSP